MSRLVDALCDLDLAERRPHPDHAGMVVVADGSREADEKLERVLTCDPGSGIMRHADAGYPDAIAAAERHNIRLPMRESGTEREP